MFTYKEIFSFEDTNTKYIYLFKEGSFLRAHGRSAYLMVRDVCASLKVSLKIIKKENREDFSVGFPFELRGKWMHGYVLDEVPGMGGNLFVARAGREVGEVEFENWCESVRCMRGPEPRFTRITKLVEGQPVYKAAYDALLEVLDVCVNVGARYRRYADHAEDLALDVCEGLLFFYEEEDRVAAAKDIQRMCRRLDLLMYILQQRKECSGAHYMSVSERLCQVRIQAGNLAKAASSRRPSAVRGAADLLGVDAGNTDGGGGTAPVQPGAIQAALSRTVKAK